MAQATPQSQPPRRRWPLPRFSLAAALVAMTLCAVGLWYWFRVPFEVVHQIDKGRREVETVHRTWNGTVRHGQRRIYLNGKLYFVENYRDGVPHGQWEWMDGTGRNYITAEFQTGKLASLQASKECDQRLAKLLAAGVIDDPGMVKKLFEPCRLSFNRTPLKDAMDILMDSHTIQISCQQLREPMGYVEFGNDGSIVAADATAEIDRPLFADLAVRDRMIRFVRGPKSPGAKLAIRKYDALVSTEAGDVPLIVAFGRILQPRGLVCDYRYGMLWIAPREEAGKWLDPTGVSMIVPPPGTALELAWHKTVKIDFLETPLRDACAAIEQHSGVKFDLSHLPPNLLGADSEALLTFYFGSVPFRHALGAMLEESDLQAKLNGETIVIELQPDHPLAGKNQQAVAPP